MFISAGGFRDIGAGGDVRKDKRNRSRSLWSHEATLRCAFPFQPADWTVSGSHALAIRPGNSTGSHSWREYLHAMRASRDSRACSSAWTANGARYSRKLMQEFCQRMPGFEVVDESFEGYPRAAKAGGSIHDLRIDNDHRLDHLLSLGHWGTRTISSKEGWRWCWGGMMILCSRWALATRRAGLGLIYFRQTSVARLLWITRPAVCESDFRRR